MPKFRANASKVEMFKGISLLILHNTGAKIRAASSRPRPGREHAEAGW